MKYCSKCGATCNTSANYCIECGASLKKAADSGSAGGGSEDHFNFHFPDLPQNISCTLCYLFTFISGMVMLNIDPYRKNAKVRFHAWQSTIFGLIWAMFIFLERAVTHLFPIFWIVVPFIHIGFFVLWILLIVKSYNGEHFKIPVIGEIAEIRANQKL